MTHTGDCVSEDKLVAYLDGTLPEDEQAEVEAHLNCCSTCQQTVDWMTEHLLKDVSADSLLFPTTLDYGSARSKREAESMDLDLESMPRIMSRSDVEGSLGRIGHYEVLKIIGKGGYGIVFEALDPVLNRHVAIKVLLPDLATQPVSRRRFIREARAGAAINHPNVVTIHGVEEKKDVPFLVMELIRGKSLRDRLHGEPKLDVFDICRIGMQIAQGLAAAHVQGIIHRDVKPGNVMLMDELNRVKLTDFGLARVVVEEHELTLRGIALGTPGYMSPEQVRGEELDTRSDLFSLGCVMFAMFTGQSPFHGRTVLEIARRVDADDPPRLREVNPSAPEFMDAIIHRLLQKDPEDRYQSAAEVADVLGRHLALINQAPTDRISQTLARPLMGEKSERRAGAWHGGWLRAGAVTLVLLGLLAAFIFSRPRNDPSGGSTGGPHPPETELVTGSDVPGHVPDRNGDSERTGLSERLIHVTVSQSGEADCRSLQEAVMRVSAGGTITVLDSARYHERLYLRDAQNLTGVHIAAPRQAVLEFESIDPLITIERIPGLCISGFKFVVPQAQFGVVISGPCPGLVLRDLIMERTSNPDGLRMSNGAIFLRAGAAGSARQPIELRRVHLVATDVGLVVGTASAGDEPVRNVVVEDCRIHGFSYDSSTLLAILRRCEDIVIRRNIFREGATGVSFVAENAAIPRGCVLVHNSWHHLESWINWIGPLPPTSDLVIHHNLVVDSLAVAPAIHMLSSVHPRVFAHNIAVHSSGSSDSGMAPCALVRNEFPLLSLEPEHPDYLGPDLSRWEEFGDYPDPLPGIYPITRR
jgi:eukaryotic-like serine/threonine-protein kinase